MSKNDQQTAQDVIPHFNLHDKWSLCFMMHVAYCSPYCVNSKGTQGNESIMREHVFSHDDMVVTTPDFTPHESQESKWHKYSLTLAE